MEVYVKKYFWLLGVIVVIVCTVFTAKAFNHFVEAKLLADSAQPSKSTGQTSSRKEPESRSKIGTPLAERNMFCSSCLPPEPESPAAAPAAPGDAVPLTKLPLKLVATNVATRKAYSFATILNTDSDEQGSYWTDDAIPGAGPVVDVRGKHVDFKNAKSGRVERISLLSKDEPKKTKTPTRPSRPTRRRPRGARGELMAMIDEGVKKTGDNDYKIDRAVVEKVLANPAAVARGARIVPSIKNGKPNGFKLYAIRPNSVYSKIGLMNGDTIHAVNGFELTTADKALEVYTKVREANSITVNATRRGKPVTLKYSID